MSLQQNSATGDNDNIHEKGRFKQTCGPCGATFEVVVMGGLMAKTSQESIEEYHCPECGQVYQCRGCAPPTVTLLTPRTDGRA